jgi:tripeptide aminopeptidase
MNRERLLERFLRYVKVDTTADPQSDSYPSSPGQLDLGNLLVGELFEIGLADVHRDEHGLVWATVPATTRKEVPTIGFNSHLDTSPETTGRDVKPQVIEDYAGGDISLPGDPSQVITVAENPELDRLHGATLITTDGTTLLGGDDKGGIAVIVEAANYLIEHPEIEHGPVRVLFTCDEEIGHGVDHVDLDKVGATACYTLDGAGANDIDIETFSADLATVTVSGKNIHPSIAKDRMVNATRAAGDFLARLPRDGMSPETTDGRDGFIHPYQVEGGVAEVTMQLILRDFITAKLDEQAELLRKLTADVERDHPGASISIHLTKQYRNMGDGLSKEPRAVDFAVEAHRRLGREPKLTIVRGGTDGSQLTELGLPTPNLSTGQHNPHSPLEWACLDEMVQAVEVVVELAKVWCKIA